MAEEDLMWGKNRHFFGGVEPSNMRSFSASSAYDLAHEAPRIHLIGDMPHDTIIDDQTLCTVAGVVIRRSEDDYPEDEFSGTLIEDIKVNTALSDPYHFSFYDENDALNHTYYYSAFPYTTQGVYNRNEANHAHATALTYDYLYGYDLTIGTTSTSGRVTYPDDVDNAGFTAAAMNYTTGKFDYGSWTMEPGEKFMPRPCMLTYAGTVSEYLDPDDYTKTSTGTSSQVASTSFGGNAMMEWNKIYVKRWESNGVYHFRCCDIQLDSDYECWSNYDRNNNEIDHFYTPIYFGSSVSSKLRSISGASSYVNNTASSEIALAKANGDDWYTEVVADRFLFQDLCVLIAKTTDTQTAFGTGRCASGNTSAIGNGTMNTSGMFWGSTNQTSGVKVFGMENPWGNLWRRTAGWINASGTQKIKLTRGTHDSTTTTDYNLDGSGYLSISGATPAGTSGGYINACKTEKFGRIPYQASGSSSTNEADGLWFNNGQTNYAFVGGDWNDALLCGAFCVGLDVAASYAGSSNGASLSCKPCT